MSATATTTAFQSRSRDPARYPGGHRRQQGPALADLVSGDRVDPPRVLPIQTRYIDVLRRAYRGVMEDVWTTVVEHDAFGIEDGPRGQVTTGPTRDFDFPTTDDKRDAFLRWLDHNLRTGVIEQPDHRPYFRVSYQRGVTHADAATRALGFDIDEADLEALFNRPVHSRTLEQVFRRALNGLDDINRAVGSEMSRVLAQGLIEGWNPNKVAREINDRIEKVGIHRARLIARTETQHALAEGTLNRFQQHGTDRVVILAEFATAGDDRVCSICASLEGEVYTVEEARGVIPAHPQCRCVFAPIRRARAR